MFSDKSRRERKLQGELTEARIENYFLKQKSKNTETAIANLIAAVKNNGPVPQYHRHVMKKHRDEWPTLWKAIDAIIEMNDERK
jgi:hypothetical protein